MIISTKVIAICMGLALTAFIVSTIVLAVQKANLEKDLKEAREKLDMLEEALRPTTTTTIATSSTTTSSTSPSPEIITNFRLPSAVVPINYNLYLHPDLETGNFTGQTIITVNTKEKIDVIKLHSNKLIIKNVYLAKTGSQTIFVEHFYLDSVREFLVIQLSESIAEGKEFDIGIIFEGSMTGKIVGLYSSSYLKADSSRKFIATSKFEPTYARLAYPCFDEPAMKATFKITLVYPNNGDYHALSNMNIESEEYQGKYTEVHFHKSVPMSTYLSCFIVSDFKYKTESIQTNGIGNSFDLRVFATPEQINKVDFALEVGKAIIEYYIQYFQIEYPLPKLDMAAIPDFVSGAMEHWGLVTYRETSLLYDEKTSSTINKQRVAGVIAHEFAHMWFGNLVTMMWWNDLWLNEGFASYIENKGVDAVFPEWKMKYQFITGTLHGVLSLDATLGSHPIIQSVENPDQITEIFDTITYSKGSSIIRMLEDFLGAEKFQQAVTNYLNRFKYKNAVTADFLAEIDELDLDFNVTEIMGTWTEQMGLPYIHVEKISEAQYKITQKRFFSNPKDYENDYNDSPYNYRWSIPITYTTSETSTVQREFFYYNEPEILITLPKAAEWIKFNYDQVGYYRVNYDQSLWQTLSEKLMENPSIFSTGDRAGLLNDAFSLADSTHISYDIPLDITRYLDKEDEYVPWSTAASKLTYLKRSLMYTNISSSFNNYARTLIHPIYEDVTWAVDDDHLKNRLRVTVLNAACSLGLEECLTEAAHLFETWVANVNNRPHPDIRETVYYYGMMTVGDEIYWDKIWKLFVAENDASEKSKLMYGLSAIQVPWILSRFIHLAWNEEYVRGQDYFTCLQNIAANPIGEPIVWDYVREHWPDLVDRFGLNERYLGNMIPSITSRFSTQTKLEEMEYFFAKYPEAGAGAAARVRALENVKNNIAWLKNNADKISIWLQK